MRSLSASGRHHSTYVFATTQNCTDALPVVYDFLYRMYWQMQQLLHGFAWADTRLCVVEAADVLVEEGLDACVTYSRNLG